jgi:hypothetical protein
MAESHLTSGLKALRAERTGELARIREEIARLEAEEARVEALVVHINAVLTHVEPNIDIDSIKPRQRRHDAAGVAPKRGGPRDGGGEHTLPVTQHVLRILREEGKPMTVEEVVESLMVQRDGADRKKLLYSVRNHLSTKVREGLLTAEVGPDGLKRYAVARGSGFVPRVVTPPT